MCIKIKYPLILESGSDVYLIGSIIILLFTSGVILSFNSKIENCRRSIYSLSMNNIILNNSLLQLQCSIPYEECRCSFILNKYNNSIECITDIESIIAHMSPIVSYILQVYIIYEIFSFSEKSNYILRDVFSFVTLFIFTIIVINAHESTCSNYNTSEFLLYSSTFLYGIFLCLFIVSDIKYVTCLRYKTYQKRRLVNNNHNHEGLSIGIVS